MVQGKEETCLISRNTVRVKGKVWNQLGSMLIKATTDTLPALSILGDRNCIQGQEIKKRRSERLWENEALPSSLGFNYF